MVDMGTITAAVSGIKAATEIAKLLKESSLSLDKAEQKFKLADLIGALADVKMEMANIQQLLIDRDHRISELEEELRVKAKLTYESPFYWLIEGSKKEGPICQQCYDNGGKIIRLQDYGEGRWHCMTCNNGYNASEQPNFRNSGPNFLL
jgi:hypothetical protein